MTEVTRRSSKLWVEQAAKPATQRQRRDILRNFVVANGFLPQSEVPDTHFMSDEEKARVWNRIYCAMDEGISALRKKRLDVVDSINKFIDHMQKKGFSPTTILGHKFKLVKFYRWLHVKMDMDDLKQSVRKIDEVGVTDDKLPTRDEIRKMLTLGTLKQKALVSFLVCTGAREGEAIQVRLSDIDFEHNPSIVRFPARTTKTKHKRYSFLSSECVELLKTYIADRNRIRESIWLFDGWKSGDRTENGDRHMSGTNAYLQVRGALSLAGLVPPVNSHPKKGEPRKTSSVGAHHEYHPHVLRARSINFMKDAGFPADRAEFLVGHDVGTQMSYLPTEEEMTKQWLEKCESTFCFLKQDIGKKMEEEVQKRVGQTTRAVVEKLQAEFTHKLEGIITYNEEQLLKMKQEIKSQFETRKIPDSDLDAILRAVSDGFEKALDVGGYVIMKRKLGNE